MTDTDDLPPLPNFLIIGAQKSATRWLRSNLDQHPEICTATEELWFFNNVDRRFYQLGEPWYRAQFSRWNGEPFLGEATPGYMMLRHEPPVVARRIFNTIPDVRLIAVLRNPVDRAQSAVVHQIRRGRLPEGADLLAMVRAGAPEVARMELITGGFYATSLRPFLERFGDQLLVLLHDDVQDDPGATYRAAVSHIGADPTFVPGEIAEVRFSNQPRARRSGFTPEERAELYEHFRPEMAELEELIHRDLSAWDPRITLQAP